MRTFRALSGLVLVALLGAAGPARAFDPTAAVATPAAAFRFGYAAYQAGDLPTALDAFLYAADRGVIRAEWMLGRMYQTGHGVERDDRRAFEIFAAIAEENRNYNPRGADAPFVANAYVALGDYYRGIGDALPGRDLDQARQLYLHAATTFADPEAQFNLALMFYAGDIGRADPVQALRWARLAAENGNPDAQALLGTMLFEGEGVARQPVLGLAYLTIAWFRRTTGDVEVQRMHEKAFSLATEAERRTSQVLAVNWLNANGAPQPAR